MLHVRQTTKGLFSAEFRILDNNGWEIGTIAFQGNLGSMEGVFDIRCHGRAVTLRSCKNREAAVLIGVRKNHRLYRPYTVREDGGLGVMFHEQDGGFFAVNPMDWHFLRLGGHDYQLYHVGFGKNGIRAPIYDGGVCVAEIRKPCLIVDGLHSFDILLADQAYTLPALCLNCYMYVITYYQAGVLVKSGQTWRTYTTRKRELLAMCHNQFSDIP